MLRRTDSSSSNSSTVRDTREMIVHWSAREAHRLGVITSIWEHPVPTDDQNNKKKKEDGHVEKEPGQFSVLSIGAFYEVALMPAAGTTCLVIMLALAFQWIATAANQAYGEAVQPERVLLAICASLVEAHAWFALSDDGHYKTTGVEEGADKKRLQRKDWLISGLCWLFASACIFGLLLCTPLSRPEHNTAAVSATLLVILPRLVWVLVRRGRWNVTDVRGHSTYSLLLYTSLLVNSAMLYFQLLTAGGMQVATWFNMLLASVLHPVARSVSIQILENAALYDIRGEHVDAYLLRVLPARVRALHLAYSLTGGILLYVPLPSLPWFALSILIGIASASVSQWLLPKRQACYRSSVAFCRSVWFLDSQDSDLPPPASEVVMREYKTRINAVVSVGAMWVAMLTSLLSPFVAMALGQRGRIVLYAITFTLILVVFNAVSGMFGRINAAPLDWKRYVKLGWRQFAVVVVHGTAICLLLFIIYRRVILTVGLTSSMIPPTADPTHTFPPGVEVSPDSIEYVWTHQAIATL
jgi:hypothetical protein